MDECIAQCFVCAGWPFENGYIMTEITTKQLKACVIGHPVKHSRSPFIHGYWLKHYGINGHYGFVDVAPQDLEHFISQLADKGYAGCNVTVPHKENVFALVDEATVTARLLGAVNTLWFENGRLLGDNTDVAGFMDNLDASAPAWDNGGKLETAIVLGAGGAARAIVHGLKSRGIARIIVVNRTLERAEALAQVFGETVVPARWDELPKYLPGAELLVNTTSLGMDNQPPLEIDLAPLPEQALVTDIVYVPLVTPLLKLAEQRKLKTVTGLGMLLHQAVPGFERWFGVRPQVTHELHALVANDIEGWTS